MAKKFTEVFPGLKLDTSCKDLFEQGEVEKITATKRRDFLRVYIQCDRLIQKDMILAVEGEIQKQLFPGTGMTVKFYEKYHLSSQYNPQKLMEVYRDSILLELKNFSHVEYTMFRSAELSYPEEERIRLTMVDTVLYRSKEEELIRILEKIFNERCGFAVSFEAEYIEQKKKENEADNLRIAGEVAEIVRRASLGEHVAQAEGTEGIAGNASGETKGVQSAASGAVAQADAAQEKAGGSQNAVEAAPNSFSKGKGKGFSKRDNYKQAVKRSDNPDVIYGRDF